MLALGASGQLGVARTTVFWMVAPPEQLVAAGVGAGPFAVNPASLLGWHHTLHEFSHEFRPKTAPSLWEVVASGTVGPNQGQTKLFGTT